MPDVTVPVVKSKLPLSLSLVLCKIQTSNPQNCKTWDSFPLVSEVEYIMGWGRDECRKQWNEKGEGKEGGEEGRKEVNVARIGISGLWFWIF